MSALTLRAPGAAALALLALALAGAPAAAQEEPRPAPPRTLVHVYATGAVSLRQDPISTTFADVWAGDLRFGVPVGLGLEPWVDGTLARLRVGCESAATDCSRMEKRVVAGLMYQRIFSAAGREMAGPYLAAGLGVQSLRGVQQMAHSIVLGLPLGGGSRNLSPVIELRVENHALFKDVLMISGGVRLGAGRRG